MRDIKCAATLATVCTVGYAPDSDCCQKIITCLSCYFKWTLHQTERAKNIHCGSRWPGQGVVYCHTVSHCVTQERGLSLMWHFLPGTTGHRQARAELWPARKDKLNGYENFAGPRCHGARRNQRQHSQHRRRGLVMWSPAHRTPLRRIFTIQG